jgi:hypothetical protein
MAAVGMVEEAGRDWPQDVKSTRNLVPVPCELGHDCFAGPRFRAPSPAPWGTIEPFQGFELLSNSRLVTGGGGRGYCPYR